MAKHTTGAAMPKLYAQQGYPLDSGEATYELRGIATKGLCACAPSRNRLKSPPTLKPSQNASNSSVASVRTLPSKWFVDPTSVATSHHLTASSPSTPMQFLSIGPIALGTLPTIAYARCFSKLHPRPSLGSLP